jgi:hypothetical protein
MRRQLNQEAKVISLYNKRLPGDSGTPRYLFVCVPATSVFVESIVVGNKHQNQRPKQTSFRSLISRQMSNNLPWCLPSDGKALGGIGRRGNRGVGGDTWLLLLLGAAL